MPHIPTQLHRTILALYGEKGARWLESLPALIAGLERRWKIAVEPPFEALSYNYVAPARHQDGRQRVLKVGVVHPELLTEMHALRLYDGAGCVRLVESDPELGAMLLERLLPGRLLSTLEDDQATTRIAAGVMRRLWRPLPRPLPEEHPFPTVARWALGLERLRDHYEGGTGPFPRSLVERAEGLFAELLATEGEQVLLHGDLHHFNILAASREPWLAIDPKGLVGERAYEVGALLRNPYPQFLTWPNPGRLMARRVDVLAQELGLDRERMVGWALAGAVLSAWWHVEEGTDGRDYALACAELLETLVL